MGDRLAILTCQRCGKGFILTSNYVRFLARCGERVVEPMQCPSCYRKSGALPKQYGRVKWFSDSKGYGFVVDGNGRETFFHQSQLLGGNEATPQEGQDAWFHIRFSEKGPEALNVELALG
jgi:CspA family cold shock protein